MGELKHAKKPLNAGPGWIFQDIQDYMDVFNELATVEWGLETFPNQIEIICSEQMIDAYVTTGLPIGLPHWRYGKIFENIYDEYKKGHQHLAYEMVINSNPSISYFLEENNMVTQALVAAHACFGHNSLFKNNYLFKQWTYPDSIVDYCIFAREYVTKCEERYGIDRVEKILDAAYALEYHGVDKYKRPPKMSLMEEKEQQERRIQERQKDVSWLWNILPGEKQKNQQEEKFPQEPEENLLYFIEKNSSVLDEWEREIIRIVRKFAQYFYPQQQTKMINEGWASYIHHSFIYRLWELGYVTDGFMQSFFKLHTGVVAQFDYNTCAGQHLNPYYVGYNIFHEIERICKAPTAEDKTWFPHLIGQDYKEMVKNAAFNFKDADFILQFLSPALIRKLRMFSVLDDSGKPHLEVTHISNEVGYRELRSNLSKTYEFCRRIPDIQVVEARIKGDRQLTLQHTTVDDIPLNEKEKTAVLKHMKTLWGYEVKIQSNANPQRPWSETDYIVWI